MFEKLGIILIFITRNKIREARINKSISLDYIILKRLKQRFILQLFSLNPWQLTHDYFNPF